MDKIQGFDHCIFNPVWRSWFDVCNTLSFLSRESGILLHLERSFQAGRWWVFIVSKVERMELRQRIAIGPRLPGHGSWEWVGEGLAQSLANDFAVEVFSQAVPECEAVILIKHSLPSELLQGKACFYCPIDRYGSAAEIDADAAFLSSCSHLYLHCRSLEKYFLPYAPTSYVEHPLNFITDACSQYQESGPVLWVGVRSNLAPVVDWLNTHSMPQEVWILTNFERPSIPISPADIGLNSRNKIRLENWSREKHLEWTAQAKAAFDVKGNDFRARHKPTAKACDFIASGVPLAMNRGSRATFELQRNGFALADCEDIDHWLSRDYWEQTVQFAAVLRETHSREQVAARMLEPLRKLPVFSHAAAGLVSSC